ncbi:MAG TPA: hypothetical protein VH143_06370 [Kofleriaceae bacterium]|jgi:hypothetical protein|nr:hypothetical protein [Kofleriaceae bacterium]
MRILIFAPHADIWVHSFPEAVVADALRASGDEVLYVTCDRALSSFCIAMAARGLTPATPKRKRAAVCRACTAKRTLLRRGFRFEGYDFDSALGDTDDMEIDACLAELDSRAVGDFSIDGVAVGRATLYEYLIQHKQTDLEITAEAWPEVRARLANTLRSLAAARRILERERPDRVITYNSLYSVNAMWRAAAGKLGIPSYFLHAGSNLRHRLETMIVARDSPLAWSRDLIDAWPVHRDQPATAVELAAVGDHFESLFAGRSVFAYSAAAAQQPATVRERFGLAPDQKLCLATMSSYDEYVAAAAIGEMPAVGSALFPTQIDWIRTLAVWFASRPDLMLLIRVHPREFPNKREGTKSQHAAMLERALSELPANVKVNWPSDQLSIYDVAEHAAVVLNAWSSAGKEMALLGIPVVAYCPELLLYPADLHHVGTTREAYFSAIEVALAEGWSFERARLAFRWWVIELVRSVANISDGYSFDEVAPRTPLARLRRLPVVREALDLVQRTRALADGPRIAAAVHTGAQTLLPAPEHSTADALRIEQAAVREQLTRIGQMLYARSDTAIQVGTLRARLARLDI